MKRRWGKLAREPITELECTWAGWGAAVLRPYNCREWLDCYGWVVFP
jgi:hypothetical protein